MEYTQPRTWVDGVHNIRAADMNRIENGLVTAATEITGCAKAADVADTYLSKTAAAGAYSTKAETAQVSAVASAALPRTEAQSTYATQMMLAALLPTGMMLPFGGTSAPPGFLPCDGRAVSRTAYSALFAEIGTANGAGDGSTTFNLPDCRGRGVIGASSGVNGVTAARGATGGSASETLTLAQIPSHSHTVGGNVVARGSGSEQFRELAANAPGTNASTSATVGGGQAHNNMPPYIAQLWVIKT